MQDARYAGRLDHNQCDDTIVTMERVTIQGAITFNALNDESVWIKSEQMGFHSGQACGEADEKRAEDFRQWAKTHAATHLRIIWRLRSQTSFLSEIRNAVTTNNEQEVPVALALPVVIVVVVEQANILYTNQDLMT